MRIRAEHGPRRAASVTVVAVDQVTALAASAVIIDAAGRVVLVKRGREPERGRWSIPGGSVEPRETLRAAAAREAFEETGLRVAVGRELWDLTIPAGDERVFEIHDFAAAVVVGALWSQVTTPTMPAGSIPTSSTACG